MQTVEFPEELPLMSENFTINVRTDKQTLIYTNQHIRNTRSLTNTRASLTATWFFNSEQLEIFNRFYIETLQNGTLPFKVDINFPELVTVYFASDYSYSFVSGSGHYRITATLVIIDEQLDV